MPIDQSKERLETLDVLSQIIKNRFGVKRNWKTLWRWARKGVADKRQAPVRKVTRIPTKNGFKTHEANVYPKLKMESLVVGGVVYSSVDAYLRFVNSLNEGR